MRGCAALLGPDPRARVRWSARVLMQLPSAALPGRGLRVRGHSDAVQPLHAAPTASRPCGSIATHARVPTLACIEAPAHARKTLAYAASVATLVKLRVAVLDG